jgi:hypothetical protein
MVNIINFAIQLWLIKVQKFFLISKIRDYSDKRDNIKYFPEKPISKIYRIFMTKFKSKTLITPNRSEKSSSGFCSILINDFHHSILKKIFKVLRKEGFTLVIKEICLSFYHILINSTRREILFYWVENFFFMKKFNLKFNSFMEQILKSYFLKFLKPIISIYFSWSIISRNLFILKLRTTGFYTKEMIKFSFFLNNKSLNIILSKKTWKIISTLKKFLIDKELFEKEKLNRISKKFLYLLGTKLLYLLVESKKNICIEKSEDFFKYIFVFSSCPFLKVFLNTEFSSYSVKVSNNFFEQTSLKYSKSLRLSTFILILFKNYETDIYNRFIFVSNIKHAEFFFAAEKKLKIPVIFQKLPGNIKVCYWKIFFFLNFFIYLKPRENACFFPLIPIKEKKKNVRREKLKEYIGKYLFFYQEHLNFNFFSFFFPHNIHFQIGIICLRKNLKLLRFSLGSFEHFYLSIVLYLTSMIFNKKFNFFTQNCYTLNKILNTKDQVKFFEENKHEYVNLLKNICIILPMNKKNQILSSFQNRLFKISEENSSSLIRSGMLIIQKIQFYKNLVRKNNTEKEKSILEIRRDEVTVFFFNGKIQIINSNILTKSKKEIQFLPIRIFRGFRLTSRSYFKKNLKKKQLIWNFDVLRTIIQGSIVFCSKIIYYFFQVKNDEVLILMSFNRCNFVFESEYTFLTGNNRRGQKVWDEIREQNKFSKLFIHEFLILENLLVINESFLPNCQLFKSSGITENPENEKNAHEIKDSCGDHIYITEAILMRVLKTKINAKPEWFIFTTTKKLSEFFLVDPRGVLIQIKSLNERGYISSLKIVNRYFYF